MIRFRVFYFLIILLTFCHSVSAEEKAKRDSLRQIINTTTSDSVRSRAMFWLADRIKEEEPQKALQLLDSSLSLRSKTDRILELNSYIVLGGIYTVLGEIETSYQYYQKVLKYETDTTLKQTMAGVYSSLVNYYRHKGELKPALECAFKAEKYYLLSEKKKNLVAIYTNIAGLFFDLNDFDKALQYDFTAITLSEKLEFPDALSALYHNVAVCYGEKQMKDSAMAYYRKSLALAIQNEDYGIIGSNTEAIGIEFFEDNQLDSAKYYLIKAKEYYEENEYYDDAYSIVYNYLGLLETKRKNYSLALTYLLKADSAGATLSFMMDRIEIKKALADLYAAMGNWHQAYASQQQYVVMNDSMQRDENTKVTRELERKYDITKKEKENVELKAENDLKESKLKANRNLLVGSGAGIVLLALLLFFIFRNYRNERKHVAVLDKLNLQLTNQRDEILNINQLLQLKVLRTQMNPHFIYNCLNAINNLVMKGENDKASHYLLNFSKLLRMILDFSDKTFVDLEDEIKFIDLYLSLESMRMGKDFFYEIKTAQHILDDDIAIPSLLIQPFIENAIWHGLINKEGEKKLTILFEGVNEKHIRCLVEDNGVGREKSSEIKMKSHTMLHESKGIRITQERIELLRYQIKNEVSISIKDKKNSSGEATGTRVELILPTQN